MRPASSRSSVSKRPSAASGDDDQRVVPLAKNMKTSSEWRPPRRAARTTPLAVRREPLTEASGLPTALDRREEEASVLTDTRSATASRGRRSRSTPTATIRGAQRRRHAARAPRDGALFRVKTYGIENLPAGRMLVIGNHAGQIAI